MTIIRRKQLSSGLYVRKFDVYINADNSGSHSSTNDDPSRLSGNLDSSWSGEGSLTQVNRTSTISDLDTHVICGIVRPDVTGTWQFRLRCDDAGYLWVGSNAESLEWSLSKGNAVCDNGGGHAPQNIDGSVTLTSGQLYAFKAMVGDRGGGDAFIVDFSGPAGSSWSASLSDTGRDGTGFYYHNAFAPNGYNLNS
jgi:hypothetical protein